MVADFESILKQKFTDGNDFNNLGSIAYLSSLQLVHSIDPTISRAIIQELEDQRSNLKMIASENYCSIAVQMAQANLLTDKYAEGYPFHRFYAGCDNVDIVESRAAELAKLLFNAEHAYVQPHSGADANLIAYWAILATRVQEPFLNNLDKKDITSLSNTEWKELRQLFGNQKLLAMNYYSGGHLSHGYRHNVSSRMFQVETYDVDRDSKLLDYDVIRKQAIDFKPLILLAGYSAYSRLVNFKIMKEIADEVGAILMVDMAHFSGLVAGKTLTGEYNPIEYADVVTSTTHKTLRGPRGGMILCKAEFADFVNKGCPLVIGGPLPHVMAAKAVAFSEANTKSFQIYTQSIVDNAKTFANACIENGLEVLTGGTDNHLLLIDVSKLGLTGRQAEKSIRDVGITINRNSLPFDTNGAWYTSGLRVGTPAISTLGMGGNEMKEIASVFGKILTNTKSDTIKKGRNAGAISRANYTISESVIKESKNRVSNLLDKFPVYPELDLAFMKRLFC